jgi:hypothetical protein
MPERLLAPAQKLIALDVALILKLDVLFERAGIGEVIHHHRVVDHEVDRHQRIDALGIRTKLRCRIAHGGEIDHGRHAGEILHQHARWAERDLDLVLAFVHEPRSHRQNIGLLHRDAVFGAEQVFQQHLDRDRQPGDIAKAVLAGLVEIEVRVGFSAHAHGGAGVE